MHEISASNLREKLLKPAKDIRSILRWGYPKFATIRFVADHTRLNAGERQILIRVILPPDRTVTRAKKKLECENLRGRDLLIDGYNVLLTVDSLLKGEFIWLCDDSFIRDTRYYFGKKKHIEALEDALEEVLAFLAETGPKTVTILLDSQISRSGELAGLIRHKLEEKGIKGGAHTSKHVDFDLKSSTKIYVGPPGQTPIVATSDGIIIDVVSEVIDIPGCLMEKKGIEALRLY